MRGDTLRHSPQWRLKVEKGVKLVPDHLVWERELIGFVFLCRILDGVAGLFNILADAGHGVAP